MKGLWLIDIYNPITGEVIKDFTNETMEQIESCIDYFNTLREKKRVAVVKQVKTPLERKGILSNGYIVSIRLR